MNDAPRKLLATLLVVAGIAAVDSLNPTTIGPALLLTMSAKPVRHILEFAVGVFLVNLAGGELRRLPAALSNRLRGGGSHLAAVALHLR